MAKKTMITTQKKTVEYRNSAGETVKADADVLVPAKQSDFTCICCGGDDYHVMSDLPTQDYAGLREDGTTYTSIGRKRIACLACGQQSILKTYQN